MTVHVEIDQREQARIRGNLRPATLYLPAAAEMVRAAIGFGEHEIEHDAPRDMGSIASSFEATVSKLEGKVVSRDIGAWAEEFGRHAGRRMPPVDVLVAWASRHGIPEERVFFVARAIARRGTRGRFFVRRARQALEQHELPRLLGVAARAIEDRWRR